MKLLSLFFVFTLISFISLPTVVVLTTEHHTSKGFFSETDEEQNTTNWDEIIQIINTDSLQFSFCFAINYSNSVKFSIAPKVLAVLKKIIVPPPKEYLLPGFYFCNNE